MTEEVRLIVAAAAPTLAVIVAAILDRRAHRKIDRQMAEFHRIISNGNELRKLQTSREKH